MEARKSDKESIGSVIQKLQALQNLGGEDKLVRIESDLSFMLVLTLLNKALDDYATNLPLILEFLTKRWELLNDCAVLHPYNQHTKINRACVLMSKYFHDAGVKNLIFDNFQNYDHVCASAGEQILGKNKLFLEDKIAGRPTQPVTTLDHANDDKVFQNIYHSIFEKQSVEYAMDYVPKDDWKYFLDKILIYNNDTNAREIMIKIMTKQVRITDWSLFLDDIQDIDLYRIVLDLDLKPLWLKYKDNNKEFERKLLDMAEEKLQSDSFRRVVVEKYKYTDIKEVRSLMFMLFEVYRRIRLQRDEYTSRTAYFGSLFFAATNSRDDKIQACNVLKEFVLNAARLDDVDSYLQDKRLYKHKAAIADGTMKTIVGIMSSIALKVNPLTEKISAVL